jgi:ribosomal-protein-alanine N-acetyltransferase
LPDEFPDLVAGRYLLREIIAADANDWQAYLADPRVYEHTSTQIMSVEEVEGLIAWFADGFRRKERVRWAVVDPQTGTMIGDVGYNSFAVRDGRAEVGYNLSPGYWRRGLMTKALEAVVEYGFAGLNLNKIEATTNVSNVRSAGLLRKLGFQQEGVLREYRNRRGVMGDVLAFGLLRREWHGAIARA